MKDPTIIAITNSKGGVGKTTTALNLGAAPTAEGQNASLIDNDPQGNLTAALGYTAGEMKHTLASLLLAAVTIRRTLRSICKRLFYIAILAWTSSPPTAGRQMPRPSCKSCSYPSISPTATAAAAAKQCSSISQMPCAIPIAISLLLYSIADGLLNRNKKGNLLLCWTF